MDTVDDVMMRIIETSILSGKNRIVGDYQAFYKDECSSLESSKKMVSEALEQMKKDNPKTKYTLDKYTFTVDVPED